MYPPDYIEVMHFGQENQGSDVRFWGALHLKAHVSLGLTPGDVTIVTWFR